MKTNKKTKRLRHHRKKLRKKLKRKQKLLKRKLNRNGKNNGFIKRKIYTLPKVLDFSNDPDTVMEVLQKIRSVILENKIFILDHNKIKYISMETLVLLTAEIERAFTIKRNEMQHSNDKFIGKNKKTLRLKTIKEYMPKDAHINSLLDKIGYWDHFSINRKWKSTDENNIYLRITSDEKVETKKIGDLIEFFEQEVLFSSSTRDKFSDAMIEAAANTVEHAYAYETKIPNIKRWWLTASLDKEKKEISFVFYDQGYGILNTVLKENNEIQTKFQRFLNRYMSLNKKTEYDILKLLVTTNLSKYKDERRGNGLISFKTFIDEVDQGELSVSTSNVTYHAKQDKITEFKSTLPGTLIVWKISVKSATSKNICMKEH